MVYVQITTQFDKTWSNRIKLDKAQQNAVDCDKIRLHYRKICRNNIFIVKFDIFHSLYPTIEASSIYVCFSKISVQSKCIVHNEENKN